MNTSVGELAARAVNADRGPEMPQGDWPADWRPVDLYKTLLEMGQATPPDQLTRADGASLLKRGSIATLIAESGSGKSTLTAWLALEQVQRQEFVAIFDFEDSEGPYVERLQSLGFDIQQITAALRYFNPHTAFGPLALDVVLHELQIKPSLIIIDAATEAIAAAIPGASSNSSDDWARFMNSFIRPLRDATGATVLLIDHPVKNAEARDGYAAGTGHKRASVDVALGLDVVKPFGRGESGEALLKLHKDRGGHLRRLANESGVLGEVKFQCQPNGDIRLRVDPPGDLAGAFRPTAVMQQVSRFVEGHAASSVREIREAVSANNKVVGVAIKLLLTEGFLRVDVDGQTHRHTSNRPFREADHA